MCGSEPPTVSICKIKPPPSHHCVDVRGDHSTCVFLSEWAHSGRAAAQIRFIASATVSLPSSALFPNLFSPLHFLHLSPAHIHPSLCLHFHSSNAITLPLSVCLLVLTIHHIISCFIIIAVMSSWQHRCYLQWQPLCHVVGSSKQMVRPFINSEMSTLYKNTFRKRIRLSDKLDSKALQHSRRSIIRNRLYYSLPWL